MEEKDRIAIAVLEANARHTNASLDRLESRMDRLENRMEAGFEEMKAETKALDAKLEAKIDASVAKLEVKVDTSIGRLDSKIDANTAEMRLCIKQLNDKMDRTLVLVLTAMASGFLWIASQMGIISLGH